MRGVATAFLWSVLLPSLPDRAAGYGMLHNPRGSNNKYRESSNYVANPSRLFDSRNLNQAGYQVGDACTADAPCLGTVAAGSPRPPSAACTAPQQRL